MRRLIRGGEIYERVVFILTLYRLVLETLEPLDDDRKCFRLINGVLVERTVKEVIPALKTNQEGLRKVLDDLVKQYKLKQDELEKWKVRLSSLPPFARDMCADPHFRRSTTCRLLGNNECVGSKMKS